VNVPKNMSGIPSENMSRMLSLTPELAVLRWEL